MLYKNATFSSLSIVNITNGYTWPWTFSTFDWFSLFFYPWKPIVVLKNVPWFHQFLPHPLAGLISWQLTCIARSVYINRLISNRWWCWKPRNEKKIAPPSKTRIIFRSNTKGFVILCNVKASDRKRKDSSSEAGWIELWLANLFSWPFRIYQTKQDINVNVITNRSHDVRKLQRQNWMFSFPTGFSVGRSYIR